MNKKTVDLWVGLFVLLVVIMNYALTRTKWGRAMFAVGGNREAARRSGINVNRIRISAFMLCSTLAALGATAARALLALSAPANIEHPPFAKELIAIGMRLFGDNPFGWRFMSTLAGSATMGLLLLLPGHWKWIPLGVAVMSGTFILTRPSN